MSLITIKKGEIALSDTLNSNFTYLDKRVDGGTFQKYSMETTYKRGDHVTVVKDGFLTCFQSKQDNNTNHPLTDTDWWEEVSISSGNGFNLFDTKLSDRVLEGIEALGWALQGTFVYKTALSGTRPGYPDFYDRCLEEKANGQAHQVDLGGMTITLYRNSNGHEFFDIKDKEVVDRWYETFGIADFYGVDVSSERIFLPRNRYYQQATDNKELINTYHKSTIPEMEESAGHSHTRGTMEISGDLGAARADGASGAFKSYSRYTVGNNGDYVTQGADFKASRTWEGETSISGAHTHNMKNVDKGDAITPPSVLKLLYYCVGNTIQDVSWVNIAEQVAGGVKEINDAKDAAIIEVNTTKDGITELGEVAKQGIIIQTDESTKQIAASKDQAINDVINSTSGIIDDFNTNAINKQNDFDVNAEGKQALVDASVDLARKAANGTIEEYPNGSAEYWAGKAKESISGNVIDDTIVAIDKTYSSSKIEAELEKKNNNGSGHMVGELVPFPVSTKYTPEGFIKPDGTEFTEGLFPDLYREYLTDHRWFDKSKIEVVGSPTITDNGIVSGFTKDSFLEIPYKATVNTDTEIKIRYTHKATGEGCLMDAAPIGIRVFIVQNDKLTFNGGTNVEDILTDSFLIDGQTYDIVLKTNMKDIVELFANGISKGVWKGTVNTFDRLAIGARTFKTAPISGSIDLKQFSISVDGKEVYSPTANTLDTCTYEEYANEVNTYGACAKWAVDDVRKTFKVPFIPSGYYLKNGDGTVNKAGLPNVTGKLVGGSPSSGEYTPPFKYKEGYGAYYGGPIGLGARVDFDLSTASPIYGASDTVEANAVAVQWFIYVANAQIGQSAIDWSRFTEAVENRAKTDLSNTTDKLADSFISKLMPDYSAGVDITSSFVATSHSFTAPADCEIIFSIEQNTSWKIYSSADESNYLLWIDGEAGVAISKSLRLSKGESIIAEKYTGKKAIFYPLKGAN